MKVLSFSNTHAHYLYVYIRGGNFLFMNREGKFESYAQNNIFEESKE